MFSVGTYHTVPASQSQRAEPIWSTGLVLRNCRAETFPPGSNVASLADSVDCAIDALDDGSGQPLADRRAAQSAPESAMSELPLGRWRCSSDSNLSGLRARMK